MNDEEKLLWMFKEVHGEMTTGACYLEVAYDNDREGDISPTGVNVMKDGNLCWSVSKVDLMFDYLSSVL